MAVLLDEPNVHLEFSDDGIFHVEVSEDSDQSVDSPGRPDVDAILASIQEHLERLAPVYYLVGLSGIQDLSLAERWQIASRMRENRRFIRRSAVYGLTKQLEFAFRVIIRVSGRNDLRVFRSYAPAREWLLQEKRAAGEDEA